MQNKDTTSLIVNCLIVVCGNQSNPRTVSTRRKSRDVITHQRWHVVQEVRPSSNWCSISSARPWQIGRLQPWRWPRITATISCPTRSPLSLQPSRAPTGKRTPAVMTHHHVLNATLHTVDVVTRVSAGCLLTMRPDGSMLASTRVV